MDRRLKEKKLSMLEAIEENATLAIISTDLDGTITSFNAAAQKMLGYSPAELIDKETPGVFHLPPEVIQRSKEFSKRLNREILPGFETFVCLSDQGLPNQFEWTYIHKNGDHFPVLLSVAALFNSEGTKTGYLGLAQDISKLKRNELDLELSVEKLATSNQKLALLNEELMQFSYRTSHDLKAPLVTAYSLSEYVLKDINNGNLEEAKQNTKKIAQQMNKLKDLVIDILSLASADLGEAVYEKIDFKNILEDIRHRLSTTGNESPIAIKENISVDKNLIGERIRISQVLENLLSNCVKYRDKNKKEQIIGVEISSHLDNIIMRVYDNGLGIPMNYQKDLFKMFKRFHPQIAEGSGLGLSIVKKNVDRMGGTINVQSTKNGTSFSISIPKGEKIHE